MQHRREACKHWVPRVAKVWCESRGQMNWPQHWNPFWSCCKTLSQKYGLFSGTLGAPIRRIHPGPRPEGSPNGVLGDHSRWSRGPRHRPAGGSRSVAGRGRKFPWAGSGAGRRRDTVADTEFGVSSSRPGSVGDANVCAHVAHVAPERSRAARSTSIGVKIPRQRPNLAPRNVGGVDCVAKILCPARHILTPMRSTRQGPASAGVRDIEVAMQ